MAQQLTLFPILIRIPQIAFYAQTYQRDAIAFNGSTYNYAQITFDLLDWSLFLQQSKSEIALSGVLPAGARLASSIKSEMLNQNGLLGFRVDLYVFQRSSPDKIITLAATDVIARQRRIVQDSYLVGGMCRLSLQTYDDAIAGFTSLAK